MKVSKILIAIIAALILIAPSQTMANTEDAELLDIIEGIIQWKKESEKIDVSQPLLSKPFLEHAGDTIGDWYPIGLGRIGYNDNYEAYLAVIHNHVVERYKTEHQLSEMKATEWHRISLAILAAGGDPTNVQGINLIEDGTYNRGLKNSLGVQGLNGWIWGLITLDSMRYNVPADADLTRAELIQEIMKFQLEDGGFSFYQDEANPDMTAMAIQALAPYYNSNETFTYEQKDLNKTVTKSVNEVINEALEKLSAMQNDQGGYASWDEENVESAAQVMVALTALGINPLEDKRFIKNNKSLLDNIMSYRMEDGGFIHSKTYNPENPSSLPDESNSMAGEQVLYALVSLYRLENGYRSLYDFRPEMTDEQKQAVQELITKIDGLASDVTNEQLQELLAAYKEIAAAEQSYVYNFSNLSDLLKKREIKLDVAPFSETYNVSQGGNGAITPILDERTVSKTITDEDVQRVRDIPTPITTEYSIEVLSLIRHFEQAENGAQYKKELETLYEYKEAIGKIEQEITSLNEEVLVKLYPFNELSIDDRDIVEAILLRFYALSPYDQTKILNYEDLKKSETQIDNLIRARIIAVGLGAVAIVVIIVVVLRIRRRKKERE